MTTHSPIREITHEKVLRRFQAGELEKLAALGITVSDTETTGLKRGVSGLTELASLRATIKNGTPMVEAFHQYILPLKPAYQDYLNACVQAKEQGALPPPYDRAKYEYAVDPRALAVTGTQLVRERLDGPITGLKVRDKQGNFNKVDAVPFYQVVDSFREFTRNGKNDTYFNAPFDLPFLAELLRDVEVDRALRANAHRQERILHHPALTDSDRAYLQQHPQPFEALREGDKAGLRERLRTFIVAPESYTNAAQYHCLMYGNLVANGFKARNNLDTVYAPLMSEAERTRGDHSALEDVVMAARVAVAQAQHTGGQVHSIAELFADLLHRVDPQGTVSIGPTRDHPKEKNRSVAGDILLKFSTAPKPGSDGEAFWNFMQSFEEVPQWSPASPKHVLDVDRAHHRLTINGERADPLSLRFLKKCAYFHQLLKGKQEAQTLGRHTVIQSIQPFDSTGTVMDVTLRTADGTTHTVQHVPFTSLRANTQFLEDHPAQAVDYITLLQRLTSCSRSVGTVLLRDDARDGSLHITVKGHQRNFGECVLVLPKGANIQAQIPTLVHALEAQLKLGAIPGVKGFDPDAMNEESDEEEEAKRDAQILNPVTVARAADGATKLTLSANVFAAMALRLNQKKQNTLALKQDASISTDHGNIAIHYDTSDKDHPCYHLQAAIDALNDFVDLDHKKESAEAKDGKKPSQLIRDAAWLLYRLEQLPGTYKLRVEKNMVVLDQRDGVDAEALELLRRLSIPFKAYDRSIKLDLSQLMENAFHWSVSLKRTSEERKKDLDKPYLEQKYRPTRTLLALQKALYEGNAKAIEMNEARQFWLLDYGKAIHGRPPHHAIRSSEEGATLIFDNKKQLIIERSDVKRADIAGNSNGILDVKLKRSSDGATVSLNAPPILSALVAYQLGQSYPTDNTPLTLPIAREEQAQRAIDAAQRFTYWLSKATGSERQTLQTIKLSNDASSVHITLPKHPLLEISPLPELQQLHDALNTPHFRGLLRGIANDLPDTRGLHPRNTNMYQLVARTRPHLKALQTLHASLHMLITQQQVASNNTISETLQHELTWLGLLLHEVASLRNSPSASNKPSDAVMQAIATAQEALSNVAYGLAHLGEDAQTLHKAIAGEHAKSTVSLLREQGKSMAHMLVDEALAAVKANPRANLPQHLEHYMSELCELTGIELGSKAFRKVIDEALRDYLKSPSRKETKATEGRIISALLTFARPEMNEDAHQNFIKQYQKHRREPHEAHPLAAQHAFVKKYRPSEMSQEAWKAWITHRIDRTLDAQDQLVSTTRNDPSYTTSGYHKFLKAAQAQPFPLIQETTQPNYGRHQQCRRLLNAVFKTREEAEDLHLALPHALRAISHLMVVLGQEAQPAASALQVKTIGTTPTATPQTVGVMDNPLALVRNQQEQQAAAIHTKLIGLLARNKTTPISTKGEICLRTEDLCKLLDVWRSLETSGKLDPEPSTEIDASSIAHIRKQHPLLQHPEVEKITINSPKTHVKIRIHFPDTSTPEEKTARWQAIRNTAADCGLDMPNTIQETPQSTCEVYLYPHSKGRAAMQSSIPRAPSTHAQRLRAAISKVTLPELA